MRLVKKYQLFTIFILFFTTALSRASHTAQTVEFSVHFSDTSLTILYEDTGDSLARSVSLHDLGFAYIYNGELTNTNLLEYGGYESEVNWVIPGVCIKIEIPGDTTRLPRLCRDEFISVPIHPGDRFWYDGDRGEFRGVTFSNTFTDQQCVISNHICFIKFERDTDIADSGQINSSSATNNESILITTVAFGNDADDPELILDANGIATSIRQSDCDIISRPDEPLPENQVLVFVECDANASSASFYIHNPQNDEIEWVVWRVPPEHQVEDPVATPTPVPGFAPDSIIATVIVAQSNIREGPGTDFEPECSNTLYRGRTTS